VRPESEPVFTSILWPRGTAPAPDATAAPAPALHDLALDQILARIAPSAPAAREAWTHPLSDAAAITYRQRVFTALEDPPLHRGVQAFLQATGRSEHLESAARAARSPLFGTLQHCRALAAWTEAVEALDDLLAARFGTARDTAGASEFEGSPTGGAEPDGWPLLSEHVRSLRRSPAFTSLAADARSAREHLAAFRYDALLRPGRVTVGPSGSTDDLVEHTRTVLGHFTEPAPVGPGPGAAPQTGGQTDGEHDDHAQKTSHRVAAASAESTHELRTTGSTETTETAAATATTATTEMLDHVQLWMLEHASTLSPELFDPIREIAARTTDFRDPVLVRFADEIRFYLALRDMLAPMRRAGLPICMPKLTGTGPSAADDRTLEVEAGWDLALGARLTADGTAVVTNDIALRGAERILVVSGPNQGGKTTLARTVGQLHHLAALGCPVPAERARIPLTDQVMCLFEREEDLDAVEGRLAREVTRLHAMLERTTSRSLLIINEAFASTALADARILTRDVLERIIDRGASAVCVTFIDELSRLGPATVSMVAQVDPEDPAHRTLRVVRAPAAGRAFARALAERHGLAPDLIAAHLHAQEVPR
jgi:DNA mismatch repair protein MutS